MKDSLRSVTEFHLSLVDFNEDTFCKITSLLENHLTKFCIFGYRHKFKCVLEFIERKKSSLKQINFRYCHRLNDRDLRSLSAIEGLDLTSIYLISCSQLTDYGLRKLCESQNNIMELNISSCEISDDAVFTIVRYLPKIKSLFMRHCSRITDVSPLYI